MPESSIAGRERAVPSFCRKCGEQLQISSRNAYATAEIVTYAKCPRAESFWRELLFNDYGHDNIFLGFSPIENYDPFTGERL